MGAVWLHWSIHPSPFPQGSPVQVGEQEKYFCGCIRVSLMSHTSGASPAALNTLPSALHLSKLFPLGFGLFPPGPVQG